MIERRYPIQTVLAERKMFAGGGAVLPQQMMPTQQSGGILASSGPLLDAVAAGALNPDGDGGGSLSEVQGFSNGGLNRYKTVNGNYVPVVPEQIADPASVLSSAAVGMRTADGGVPVNLGAGEEFAPRQGERVLLGAGATRDDMRARMLAMANMGPAGKEDLVLPRDAQLQGAFSGGRKSRPGFAGLGLEPGPRSILDDTGRTTVNFVSQVARELSQAGQGAKNILFDVAEFVTKEKPEDTGGNFYGQIEAVSDALRRHPRVEGVSDTDIQNEISRVSKEIVSQKPDISGKSLGAILAEHLVTKYEAPYREATELQDNAGDEFNAGDYNFIYDRSGLESDDGLNEEGLIDESLPSENQAATTTANQANQEATTTADPTVDQDEAEGEFVGSSQAVEGGPTVSSSVFGFETPKDDVYRGTTNKVKRSLENAINATSPDKTKSAMAAAVEEFNAAMPEYEGMSESEKGFAIMEAGLRIMAGKSSDALTNIAEGLKGLGPKFAKDAKEKRAWNRQVDLSAAKYGLEKIAKDAAEQRADAKAEGKLDSRVWILNKGESHPGLKPGEGMIPTVAQMRDSTFLGKFSTQDSMIEKLKVQGKKLKSQIDGMKQFVTDPSKFLATSKEFRKLSARVGTNMATKSLLNEAISLISKSKKATAYDKENGTNSILGIKGLWKDLALRIGNATGQKQFMIDAFGEAIQDKGKFNQFANGATTKHIEGLIMEGGKITEQERALGLELSGAIQKGFWSGVFTDKDRTLSKLTNFAESLDRDTESRFKTLQGIESDWINRYSDIGKLQADRLDSTRSRSYGTRLRKSREGMLVPRSASRKGSTEIFFSDVVLTDKDGAMTGLKENWDRTTR